MNHAYQSPQLLAAKQDCNTIPSQFVSNKFTKLGQFFRSYFSKARMTQKIRFDQTVKSVSHHARPHAYHHNTLCRGLIYWGNTLYSIRLLIVSCQQVFLTTGVQFSSVICSCNFHIPLHISVTCDVWFSHRCHCHLDGL